MVPKTYVPNSLSKNNRIKQKQYLKKSQKLAKNGIYFKRPKIKSFVSKVSPLVIRLVLPKHKALWILTFLKHAYAELLMLRQRE